jgi:hypothetical protein
VTAVDLTEEVVRSGVPRDGAEFLVRGFVRYYPDVFLPLVSE